MGTLQLQQISLAFGDRDILSQIDCTIDTQTKAALAGANGSGKTTLLNIITGLIEPDSGEIHTTKGLSVAYLPQNGIVYGDATLFEELDIAFHALHTLTDRKTDIEHTLSLSSDHTSRTDSLLQDLHEIEEQLINSGYYHRKAKIMQVAAGLGFDEEDLTRECSEFSGGWQMRIALGKILLEHPDLLLLDEPTNYLDLEARVWLKNYLKQYSGGYVLVSHDRYFLDETIDHVLELFQGSIHRYTGNYTKYEQTKVEELQMLKKRQAQQELEIAHLEEFIERFRSKATKAKQVQSRIKQLEKIVPIVLPESSKHIAFKFPEPPHSGKKIFDIEHLYKAYGEHTVLNDLSLLIEKGDRLSVTGKNGTGKTTLLKILSGADPEHTGFITAGTGVKIGYFAQDTEKTLDPKNTVLTEIEQHAPTSQLPRLRNLLGSFLFRGDDIHKSVSILSGGEKSRLALLKILLQPVNVLILDEPTNHLDLASKDMLLEALLSYTGTLIFVSHDVDFIKRLAGKILYLTEDSSELFVGDYEYFSWKLDEKQRIESLEEEASAPEEKKKKAEPIDRNTRNKMKNRMQKLQRQEQELMEALETLEQELSSAHEEMSLPENYSSPLRCRDLQQKITGLEQQIEQTSTRWDEITGELASLEESLHE